MHQIINCPVFVFLGPPGSGKGSQAKKLAKLLSLPHISTGDLIRQYVRQKGDLADSLRKTLNAGNLVSDELILSMLTERVSDSDCSSGFILDGYPRTSSQAEVLDQYVSNLDQLIFLNVLLDDQTIVQRLMGRRTCSNCSKIYHIAYAPSKREGQCDDCDDSLHIRKDDQESVILNRLALFKKEFCSMKTYYENRPLWIDLPSSGTLEECFSNLVNRLSKKVPHLILNTSLTR